MSAKDPFILAVETSTAVCSVALLVADELYVAEEKQANHHAETLLPMIHDLLQRAALSLPELDALAVGRGPGSFTGIRIGIAAVQGLAFATGLPVIPISSLASLAAQAHSPSVLAALDARMGQVYWGAYKIDESPGSVMAATLVGREYVSDPEHVCCPDQGQWVGAGSAWSVYPSQMPDVLQDSIKAELRPSGALTARLAVNCFRAGAGVQADALKPAYLRHKVANRAQVR